MVKCNVQTINDNGRYAIMFDFDDPEARGIVIVRPAQYGLEIILPAVSHEANVFIDLFHTSKIGMDSPLSRGKPEIHLFDACCDEPAVVASFLDDNRISIHINGQMEQQERRIEFGQGIVDTHTEFVFEPE